MFFAGDSAEAKAPVAAFLESLGLRPLDAGGLEMTYALEWAGILLVGLAHNGARLRHRVGRQGQLKINCLSDGREPAHQGRHHDDRGDTVQRDQRDGRGRVEAEREVRDERQRDQCAGGAQEG